MNRKGDAFTKILRRRLLFINRELKALEKGIEKLGPSAQNLTYLAFLKGSLEESKFLFAEYLKFKGWEK